MSNFFDPIFLIKVLGPAGIFTMVFIESGLFFGFFFPGDSLLFTSGLLVASGFFQFFYIFAGCAIAAFLGGLFGYLFGEQIGPAIFSRHDSIFFHRKHIDETHGYFSKYGNNTIFLARFLPIVRTFAPILAGVGKMKYSNFILYNFAGAVVWSFMLIGGGYYLGKIVPNIDKYILPIVVLIIVVSFSPALYQIFKKRRSKNKLIKIDS